MKHQTNRTSSSSHITGGLLLSDYSISLFLLQTLPKILSRLLQLGILPMHEANLSRGQEQTQAPSGSYLAESN